MKERQAKLREEAAEDEKYKEEVQFYSKALVELVFCRVVSGVSSTLTIS